MSLAALLPSCLIPATAQAEVTDQLDYRYYIAQAQNGRSLFLTLQDASPIRESGRVFLGHTERSIEWRLHWQETPNGTCRITEIRTSLRASIILPQLNGIDAGRQAEYTRFLMALRIHETGHYRIAQQAAQQIDAALAALPEMHNCREVEETANSTGHRIVAEFDAKDVQYDSATKHGQIQGAVLQN
jgi:predicted secreted Zn-dependent protease